MTFIYELDQGERRDSRVNRGSALRQGRGRKRKGEKNERDGKGGEMKGLGCSPDGLLCSEFRVCAVSQPGTGN